LNDITPSLDKRWIWTAAVGLAFFLLIQVFPVTGQLFTADVQHVMTRSEAEKTAIATATEKFGINAEDIDKTTVTHISDSKTTGYFSKYSLMNEYDRIWSEKTPTDVYVVQLFIRGVKGALALSLNMENGQLVAWQHVAASDAASGIALESSAELAKASLEYAASQGIDTKQWEWTGNVTAQGLEFASRRQSIGEAEMRLRVLMPESLAATSSANLTWQGGAVTYGVNLPSDFLGYMKTQERWAANLSVFGFILPQIILFILAIIYAGSYSSHTSFRRGIFLSVAFFVLYAGLTFNMIPGLRAGTWDAGVNIGDNVNLVVSLVTYAAMALLTYFSAVGGDGVWKSMGRSLWPRWKESGYGAAVLKSMREGYFLAFILLGAQSLILLALEKSLGSFSASDPTQSMYNMTYPLLLPLLAWCAGISEELQSRLFGIGLFRKWFVGIARGITGKEPSPRTAFVLTAIAIIPPGLMWALGHVGYAVYPVYTRLIELVLMSFLFGWFMLRFGVMTVIFAHVTLDAILMGVQMMFDGLPYDFAGGVFSLMLPGIVGIVIWRLHGAIRTRS